MSTHEYKHYTETTRRGIRGEAYFECLIVQNAIPHRIARHNDLGVDFLCEWVVGDQPTGILFAAQVKSTTTETVQSTHQEVSRLNGLNSYTLAGAQTIDERTLSYWKGLGLPAFLFVVVEDVISNRLSCYYKRYTPLLDGYADEDDKSPTTKFYLVNRESSFLAFADTEKGVGGFARDLVIDYARLSYSKGHIVQLTPKKLRFWPFPVQNDADTVKYFGELIERYQVTIKDTCEWTAEVLRQIGNGGGG